MKLLPTVISAMIYGAKTVAAVSNIFSMGNNNKQLREFDATTGEVVASYPDHDSSVTSHDYSPNGAYLVSTTYMGFLYVFDTSTKAAIRKPVQLPYTVIAPTVSVSVNNTIAVASGHTVLQYDLKTGNLLTTQTVSSVINFNMVAYSPDGSQFTTVETDGSTVNLYGNIRQFDSKTGEQMRFIEKVAINGLRAVTYSPNGQYFAVTPGSSLDINLRVYNVKDGALLKTYSEPNGLHGDMRCVAFSPDSSAVVAGGADRTLRQYNVQTGAMLTKTVTTGAGGSWINGCDYRDDGKQIAFSEDYSKMARVIDAVTGKDLSQVKDWNTPYMVKYKL